MAKYTAEDMNDVMRFNKEIGHHFFDKDTMKFWGSKIESHLHKNNTFITSERNYDNTKRLFTVRYYNPETAEITTVGEFQAFSTGLDAEMYALGLKEEDLK